MSLNNELRQEINEKPAGIFAPYYFRYLGYREDMSVPAPIFRAKGQEKLGNDAGTTLGRILL